MTGDDVIASYTDHVLRVVAHLIALESKTGRTVQLALEPEPYCFLETTDETIAYFRDHLYSGAAVEKLAKLAHVPISEANEALRRHVGIVYDICHQAVEYEISRVLSEADRWRRADLQISGSRRPAYSRSHAGRVNTLKRYAKTIYLTQTIQKKDGKLTKFLNVDDAIAVFEKEPGPREWRTHIHVPVFLDDLGQFRTTRFAMRRLAFPQAKAAIAPSRGRDDTWDVLPDNLKMGDIVDNVCRELEWVRGQLV